MTLPIDAIASGLYQYDTEADLLGDAPPVARFGFAADTGNVFFYAPVTRGWVPMLPTGDHAGQLLARTSVVTNPVFAPVASGGPIPVTAFPGQGGAIPRYNGYFTETIPGGYLGANGFVRYQVEGNCVNGTGGALTVRFRTQFSGTVLSSMETATIAAGATEQFSLHGLVKNLNDPTVQGGSQFAMKGVTGSLGIAPDMIYEDASGAHDTTTDTDFILSVGIMTTSASFVANIDGLVVESVYIA